MISEIVYGISTLFLGGLAYAYYTARSGRCYSKAKLDGKTVVITGANTGIGKETAKDMAKRGATVIMCCRDMKKGEIALKDVKEFSGSSDVYLKKLDLSSLASVKEFARNFLKEFKNLNILINNAGVMTCPHSTTEDGFEMQFGVNHLGHFVLTNLLLEKMVESAPSRIVNVSSSAHYSLEYMDLDDLSWKKKGYDRHKSYGQSKLANVMFTNELHRRVYEKGVTSYSLHPGAVETDLQRHHTIFWLLSKTPFFKTVEEGAQTSIYCAVQEGLESKSGCYFVNCDVASPSKKSQDAGLARKLWEKSEEMTGVKFPF